MEPGYHITPQSDGKFVVYEHGAVTKEDGKVCIFTHVVEGDFDTYALAQEFVNGLIVSDRTP